MKPHLLLLRCGPDSPHLDRLAGLVDAAFDVALSWSGALAPSVPGAVFVHAVAEAPGGPWAALGQTLAAHAERLADYGYVWMPDDDIVFDAATVARLFMVCEQLGLELAQPAFVAGSPAAHPLALQHPGFQLRFTNHVDMAAPVLSRSMLAKVLPTLADPALVPDRLWPRLSRLGRVAVVDATPVARRAPRSPLADLDDDLLNLGGLLESGDAWCLGPQAAGVDVMLQALLSAGRGLNLGAQVLTGYLARHLALVDSGACRSVPVELDHALSPSGMRFNSAVVAPEPGAGQTGATEATDATAAAALALCQADLQDLQARYQALRQERDAQDELLQRMAGRLSRLAQEVSAPAVAPRRVEAV